MVEEFRGFKCIACICYDFKDYTLKVSDQVPKDLAIATPKRVP